MHMSAQDDHSNPAHFIHPAYPSNHLVNRLPSTGPLDPLYRIQATLDFEGRGVQRGKPAC